MGKGERTICYFAHEEKKKRERTKDVSYLPSSFLFPLSRHLPLLLFSSPVMSNAAAKGTEPSEERIAQFADYEVARLEQRYCLSSAFDELAFCFSTSEEGGKRKGYAVLMSSYMCRMNCRSW